MGFPMVQAACEHYWDLVMAFAESTDEVGDGTACTPTALLVESYEGVRPSRRAGPNRGRGIGRVDRRGRCQCWKPASPTLQTVVAPTAGGRRPGRGPLRLGGASVAGRRTTRKAD